jgi:cysteinyl-tRNA synthetase
MAAPDVEQGVPAAGKYASQRLEGERWPRLRHYYTYGRYGEASARFIERFQEALDDDLNSPLATAAIFDYIGELYSAGIGEVGTAGGRAHGDGEETGQAPVAPTTDLLAVYRCLARHLYVLGIEFPNETLYPQLAMECAPAGGGDAAQAQPYKDFIQRLLEQRLAARQARDFARADLIRDLLAQAGLAVEDTPQGPRWELA